MRPKIHKFYTMDEFKGFDMGKKKSEFVAWLMRKGVPLNEARLICHRKFYHGDPFKS